MEPRCEATICGAASAHLGGKPRERVIDCTKWYVGTEQSRAQALQQNEMDAPAPCLFIDAHQLLHARRSDPLCGCRKSCALEQRTDAGGVRFRKVAKLLRQIRRHDHSGGDRLAVQPGAVAQARLDGVAEGVTEIEKRAYTVLALVPAHDFGLDSDRTHHRVFQ